MLQLKSNTPITIANTGNARPYELSACIKVVGKKFLTLLVRTRARRPNCPSGPVPFCTLCWRRVTWPNFVLPVFARAQRSVGPLSRVCAATRPLNAQFLSPIEMYIHSRAFDALLPVHCLYTFKESTPPLLLLCRRFRYPTYIDGDSIGSRLFAV